MIIKRCFPFLLGSLAAKQPEMVRKLAAKWTRQTEEYIALAKKDAPPDGKLTGKK